MLADLKELSLTPSKKKDKKAKITSQKIWPLTYSTAKTKQIFEDMLLLHSPSGKIHFPSSSP